MATVQIVLLQSVIPTVMSYAMCFTIAAGLFDISSGSIIVLAAMIGGKLCGAYGMAGLIVGCVLIALILGIINGAVYIALKIPSLIVCLGLLLVYEVLGTQLGYGVFVTIDPVYGMIGKFPYSIFIMIGAAVLFYFMYYHTKFSCHLGVVGSDELLARTMGVKTSKIKFLAFAVSGLFLGITAVLQITYADTISTAQSMTSVTMIFRPMICVFIASTMKPFCNMAIGVFVSQFTLSMIFNALIALGLPSIMQNVVLGVTLLSVCGFVVGRQGPKKRLRKKTLA
nr:hypothetical protein [Diplocloster modestus]